MARVARVDGIDNDRSVATFCGAVSAGGHTRLLMGEFSLTMQFFATGLSKLAIFCQ